VKASDHFIKAVKSGLTRAFVIFAILSIPVFGIKWGVSHRDFGWLHFFQKAAHVNFSPESMIWSDSFSVTVPWQEKAALLTCTLFAAYIFIQLATNISIEEKAAVTQVTQKSFWQVPEHIFTLASYAFLFLYVAACALCERTNLGVLTIEYSIASIYRDIGIAALVVIMAFLSRFLVRQASFNGMLTRDDFAHAYRYLVAALGALAMCFATWLPFFALPGALIMVRFALGRIKEIDYWRAQFEAPDYDDANAIDENTSSSESSS
jgi:hypothetical protein